MAKLLTFCSAQRWYIPIRYLISRFIITFFLWQGKSLETSTLLQIPRLSLAFFLSLSHCEIQIQFSSREYFHYIFFPFSINVNVLSPCVQFLFIFFFFQALHLDSFVPTLRPLITRCDLLKNVQFICCAFDVLFLCRGFSNTFLGIALIRR